MPSLRADRSAPPSSSIRVCGTDSPNARALRAPQRSAILVAQDDATTHTHYVQQTKPMRLIPAAAIHELGAFAPRQQSPR